MHVWIEFRGWMGDRRWVGESVRVSKVCGAYLGGDAV